MRCVVPAVLACSTMGCAAILSSGPDPVFFNSAPEGAQVIVNGDNLGTTPVELELHPDVTYVITFRRDGCEDATTTLETHVQAGYAVLDVFLTGLIGVVVDAATGEWKAFNDGTHSIALQCG